MDKKSLFAGMGLGAAIAFSGMLLGGMQAGEQDIEKMIPDAQITKTDVLRCREIQLLGPGGQLTMKLSGTDAGGVISVLDSVGREAARVASSLHAGGTILTKYRGRAVVTLSGSKFGGSVQVHNGDAEDPAPVVEIRSTPQGGWVGTKDGDLNLTGQMPELMKNTN